MIVNYGRAENMTRNTIVLAISVLVAGLALPVGAADDHGHHAASGAKPTAAASAALTAGEVRNIDKAAGKLTIKHGPMPKFDMPAMTMAYRVKDKAMLEQLKAGDKISFDTDGAGGEITVLRQEKRK